MSDTRPGLFCTQDEVQLELFSIQDCIADQIDYAMNIDLNKYVELRSTNSDSYYVIKAIRDATGRRNANIQHANAQWIGTIKKALGLID